LPKPEPVIVKESPPPPAPVEFPRLKLQGIIWNTKDPVAIIDGKSYGVGDSVGGVKVKAVERDRVLVELAGATNTLKIE